MEGQAGDRSNLDPWHSGNQLVQAVAAVNKNTIVVIHSVGPLILETILALPNVVAVVWAGIPGQESGNGLVDVLYGATSPSGKLPYTIAQAATDYGTAIVNGGSDSYPEGLYVDYRHFDHAGITPRYEFGFGLCKCSIFNIPAAINSYFLRADTSSIYDFLLLLTNDLRNHPTIWFFKHCPWRAVYTLQYRCNRDCGYH